MTIRPALQGPGFRQSMAWLHTWAGLWFSWLLFAIFLTGTLAVFHDPINHWMKGGVSTAAAERTIDRDRRLALGLAYMAREHADRPMWEIWPANDDEGNALNVFWKDDQGHYTKAWLDPSTGQEYKPVKAVQMRETLGGHLFVDFHYRLHAGLAGLWIVAAATVAMLVALVSGIVTHKRIFKDFFTFRPAKGQRSWLDGHNAAAVLSLPFQFMIAFSGIAISALTLFPAPIIAHYGPGDAGRAAFRTDRLPASIRPVASGKTAGIPDLGQLARRAEVQLGQPVSAVTIDQPGDAAMRIAMYGAGEEHGARPHISRTTGMIAFDADSSVTDIRRPGEVAAGAASLTNEILSSLHMAGFGGIVVKWIYFLCGLAGTAMMGTGAVLFMVKRRNRHGGEFGAATARTYRVIEALNVAAITGLGLACIGYLWANRLIPASLAHRELWEVRMFFAIWAIALAHACLRSPLRAWLEQLAALAVFCLVLPVLNLATTGDQLVSGLWRGDAEAAGVELASLMFGSGALLSFMALRHKLSMSPSPRKCKTASVKRSEVSGC
ncbi:MAG: PepSY-associated TM helix domain-containing protein [Novosphingobium sp.]